jgi:hypothetical protein
MSFTFGFGGDDVDDDGHDVLDDPQLVRVPSMHTPTEMVSTHLTRQERDPNRPRLPAYTSFY